MANSSAGLGGMMIRNLRKPTDYAKAVMTQDQLLKIAIANDANIGRARRDIQLGVPPPVPLSNLRTAAEEQLDIGKQESDGLRNLMDLGFSYDRASSIIIKISPDDRFKMNRTFPALQNEFGSRYDVKLITVSFFIDYLNKYLEELDASKGVSSAYGLGYIRDKFDELIDTTNELKAVIPTIEQISSLMFVMEQRYSDLPALIIDPITERLNILMDLLPDEKLYNRLDDIMREDGGLGFKLNQELQNSLQGLPSREQFSILLEELTDNRTTGAEGLKKIEEAVGSLEDQQISQLGVIQRIILDVESKVVSVNFITGDVDRAIQLELAGEWVGFGRLGDGSIVQLTAEGEKIKMTKPELDKINKIVLGKTGVSPKLAMKTLTAEILRGSDAELVAAINAKEYSTQTTSFEGSTDRESYRSVEPTRGQAAPSAPSPSRSRAAPERQGRKETFGLGLAKRKIKLPKTKVKGGIMIEKTPPYRQLGKYVIHHRQLMDNDMLNVKYKSLGRIPQFKPIPVSDNFKDYIIDVLDTGKHSERNYKHIPVEEKKVWEKIVSGAGLGDTLRIKKTITDDDKSDMERFDMLKGQYISGNNSPTIIRELRRFVVKFLSEGRLKRPQALDLLLELSI